MQIRTSCPKCDFWADWEIELRVLEEIAWGEGYFPVFGFICARCDAPLHLHLIWRVEPGGGPRRLLPVGGAFGSSEPVARMVLVASCPHRCGRRLGFRLEPTDPMFQEPVEAEELVLGGYRCPTCDGEGRLILHPTLRSASSPPVGKEFFPQ